MKNHSSNLKILDLLVFFVILAAGVFLTVKAVSKKGSVVCVNADGQEYEYSMSKNGTFTVEGMIGPTTFEIKDGKVRITDSCCPNKTCVEQGWTSPIVCLPNKVIIRIIDYGEFDAVVQ